MIVFKNVLLPGWISPDLTSKLIFRPSKWVIVTGDPQRACARDIVSSTYRWSPIRLKAGWGLTFRLTTTSPRDPHG